MHADWLETQGRHRPHHVAPLAAYIFAGFTLWRRYASDEQNIGALFSCTFVFYTSKTRERMKKHTAHLKFAHRSTRCISVCDNSMQRGHDTTIQQCPLTTLRVWLTADASCPVHALKEKHGERAMICTTRNHNQFA